MNTEISTWKGSSRTAAHVASQISARWGESEALNYHPSTNCFTLKKWNQLGYRVKAGEKALNSLTFIPMSKNVPADQQVDGTKKSFFSRPRNVNLFYILQVEKVSGSN